VVGNGPSLDTEQLTFVHNERKQWITLGVNRIYKIFDKTPWRPDIMFFADLMRGQPWHIEPDIKVYLDLGIPVWVRSDLTRYMDHEVSEQVTLFPDCPHSTTGFHPKGFVHNSSGKERVAKDWPEHGLCKAGGTLFIAMQFAAMMRADRIVLIGVDGKYTADEKTNHMVPDYLPGDVQRTPEQADMDNSNLEAAHKIAARECKERGVHVINSSTETYVPLYERIPLEEVPE